MQSRTVIQRYHSYVSKENGGVFFLKLDMFCGQIISLQGWNMLYADEHVED